MKWIFGFLVCFVLKNCDAQQASAKQASVLCFKDETTNTFNMTLTVKLNTDPQGALWAISNTDYNQVPYVITKVTPTCMSTYDTTNGIYTLTSMVDLSSTSTQDNNDCGRVKKTGVSSAYWEWYIMHVTSPPASNQQLLIMSRDRVYMAKCIQSNLTSNILTSQITVSTPSLNQNVNPTQLLVTLKVQKKNSVTNAYADVIATDTVTAGSILRLTAVYDRTSTYQANVHVHSISLYNTVVSPSPSFSNDVFTLINDKGCAYTSGANSLPPTLSLTSGFKGSASGSLFTLTTGDFRAWKDEDSNTLSFRAYFKPCFFDNTLRCTDACKASTGATEPSGTLGRKRRQAPNDEQPGVATVVIHVRDSDDGVPRTAEDSSETNTMVLVGATVGVAVVLIVAVLICMLAVIRNRKMEKKQHNSNLPVVIPNDHKY